MKRATYYVATLMLCGGIITPTAAMAQSFPQPAPASQAAQHPHQVPKPFEVGILKWSQDAYNPDAAHPVGANHKPGRNELLYSCNWFRGIHYRVTRTPCGESHQAGAGLSGHYPGAETHQWGNKPFERQCAPPRLANQWPPTLDAAPPWHRKTRAAAVLWGTGFVTLT